MFLGSISESATLLCMDYTAYKFQRVLKNNNLIDIKEQIEQLSAK